MTNNKKEINQIDQIYTNYINSLPIQLWQKIYLIQTSKHTKGDKPHGTRL